MCGGRPSDHLVSEATLDAGAFIAEAVANIPLPSDGSLWYQLDSEEADIDKQPMDGDCYFHCVEPAYSLSVSRYERCGSR